MSQPFLDMIVALGWAPNERKLTVGRLWGQIKTRSIDSGTIDALPSVQQALAACLAYSPDGKWLAIGRKDGRVLLQEVSSGRVLASIEGHSTIVSSIALSPNGSRLVTAGYDGLIISGRFSHYDKLPFGHGMMIHTQNPEGLSIA